VKVIDSGLEGVKIVEPEAHVDARGFFMESFNRRDFARAVGRDVDFVQDNHSRSSRGVLRGLHYQLPPHAQAKLVRVVAGEIYDVAVDVRRGSPTLGKWTAAVLSAENRRQAWIPEGFAHGFMVLSESADVLYKTTDYYAPGLERAVAWNDPAIGIAWPAGIAPLLSTKDLAARTLAEADLFE
jgi:dTDP-4-dehydrorhamnose 3,5-epimerase